MLYPFEEPRALEVESEQLCDFVNELGAKTRGISEVHVSKITKDQTRGFLSLPPREFRLVFNVPTPMPEETAMQVLLQPGSAAVVLVDCVMISAPLKARFKPTSDFAG